MTEAELKPNTVGIRSVRLIETTFQRNDAYVAPESKQAVSVGYRYSLDRIFLSPVEAKVRFGLTAFEGNEDAPFWVRAEYEGHFSADDNNAASLEVFCKYNALALMLPYIRETISSLTVKGGFSALLVPPMNVQDIADKHDRKLVERLAEEGTDS